MKKIILFVAVICFLVLPKSDYAQPKSTFFDNWFIGINGGPTFFLGDVTQHHPWYSPDFTAIGYAFGIKLTKEMNCLFAFRGEVYGGKLRGEKDEYAGGSPANLSFKNYFWQYNGSVVFNVTNALFGNKPDRKFNTYLFGGIGMMNFKTKLYQNDVEIASWGYSRKGTYKLVTEVTVPYGVGFDYRLGKKVRVNLDIEHVWADGEKLDRVVGEYDHDTYFYINLGVTFNLSKYNRVCQPKVPAPVQLLISDDSLQNLQNQKIYELMNKADSLRKNMDNLQKQLLLQPYRVDTVMIIRTDSVFIQPGPAPEAPVIKTQPQPQPQPKTQPQSEEYILGSIYFELDKYNIRPQYEKVLDTVAKVMIKYPDMVMRVVGNTDPQGNFNYNEKLGKKRADQAVNELVKKYGISKSRLVPETRGQRELVTNSTIMYELNRRVDFIPAK